MHILMTVNAAWNIWNFRRPVVEALRADGHQLTVLAPPDDSVSALRQMGVEFEPLKMSVKGLNPVSDFQLMRRFRAIFARQRPDVILSYTIKNNVFGALAARALDIPFIPNVTGLGTVFLSGATLQKIAETLYQRAFAGLPRIFFQNSDDSALFVQRRLVQPAQVALLPGSGIDLNHFAKTPLPPPGAPPVFLMIARLLRDKGVVEFVEAARQIKTQVPQARFQLLGAAGSENRSAISAATVKDWVASGLVEHLGTTSDVRPFIAAANCVVLPSYREGAPRTLIEAAAMGRPVITTDVPGCRAVMEEGVSGFLCAARNAQSLAKALERFIDLPAEAQSAMGAAGRNKMAREFDEAIVVNAYRQTIDMLTQAH